MLLRTFCPAQIMNFAAFIILVHNAFPDIIALFNLFYKFASDYLHTDAVECLWISAELKA